MPVPTTIASLSTTASANPPAGNTPALPEMDDHIRQAYAFIAALRDGKLDASAVSAFMLTVLNDVDAAAARATLGAVGLSGNETVAGIKTFSSSPVVPSATTSGQAVNKGQLDGKADLAGSASQSFSVANASSSAHAVALGQFVATLSSAGSFEFPGGLIVKWGTALLSPSGGTSVSFFGSFSSALGIIVSANDANTVNNYRVSATNLSTSGFTGVNTSAGSTSVTYLAFGT